MSGTERPWHAWYQRFASGSTEVYALQVLEPADLPDWAIQLRQEFPTVPPGGIEMCHARWLETLDRLIADIGDGKISRRSHWCGDIPPETIAGLGLRRRILQAWMKNTPRADLLAELAEGFGRPPDVADLIYDTLGEVRAAGQPVRQDVEVLADMFAGPFEAGNAPILAKWQARYPGLRERGSILAQLGERYFPVLTNLCNFRTLSDIDRLIGMVARQEVELSMLGPCNWSLKFLLQDEPERLSASLAAVWALHRFAATEFHARIEQTPLGVRDQVNAFSKRLGYSNAVRAWLAASLGFVVKKWVRRAWHIAEVKIPEAALPDFSFPEAVESRADGSHVDALTDRPADRTLRFEKDEVIASASGARRSKAPTLGPDGEAAAATVPEVSEPMSEVGTSDRPNSISDASASSVALRTPHDETRMSQGVIERTEVNARTRVVLDSPEARDKLAGQDGDTTRIRPGRDLTGQRRRTSPSDRQPSSDPDA